MKCLYIPREINEQYVFIWKRDEIIFLMLPWLFFIVIGGLFGFALSLICTIIVAGTLKQLELNKPSGYMLHWVKFNLPKQFIAASFSKRTKIETKDSLLFRAETFPPAHIRHIAG